MFGRHLFPRLRSLTRRCAALLMLLLQVGVGISPVLDHDGRIPASHAEGRGSRHPKAHNERTCVVCAVRALQAPVILDTPAPRFTQNRACIDVAEHDVIASRDPPPFNATRAPPRLS